MSHQTHRDILQQLSPTLQAFLRQHQLQESLLPPLAALVEDCIHKMSHTATPATPTKRPAVLVAPDIDPHDQLKTLEFPDNYDITGTAPAHQIQHIHEPLELASTVDALPLPEELLRPSPPHNALPTGETTGSTGETTDSDSSEGADIMVSTRVTKYTKQALIAIGGMGQIWRVHDKELNRTLAMKLLQDQFLDEPELLSRFVAEAQITAQLDHPGVIPIYEFGQLVDGQWYYTMKEVKGQTLGAAIQACHKATNAKSWGTSTDGWSLWRLLDVFKQICRTIGYAHSLRVVHRDLKPDNVILGEHGEVFLLDWGLAKILNATEEEVEDILTNETPTTHVTRYTKRHSTQPGDILGTPSYMAPEQMLAPHKVDARCDVYALGAILYEILAGTAPFTGSTAEAVLYQMMMGPPPPPGRSLSPSTADAGVWRESHPPPPHFSHRPILPDGLIELCAQAMDRKPDKRLAHAGLLANALDRWLETSSIGKQ